MCLKFALGHVKQCLPDFDILASMTLVIYILKASSYIFFNTYTQSLMILGGFLKKKFTKQS